MEYNKIHVNTNIEYYINADFTSIDTCSYIVKEAYCSTRPLKFNTQ